MRPRARTARYQAAAGEREGTSSVAANSSDHRLVTVNDGGAQASITTAPTSRVVHPQLVHLAHQHARVDMYGLFDSAAH
ncbi:hypothetical protein K1719_029056 [Acacia pycnantha]|nr:hypothetical protein K1719_029056 [Acacia pycnantha]